MRIECSPIDPLQWIHKLESLQAKIPKERSLRIAHSGNLSIDFQYSIFEMQFCVANINPELVGCHRKHA